MQTPIERAIFHGEVVEGMSFNEKCWALLSRIPRGKVTTYADLAHELNTKAYRAVGNAMNRNPYAPAVPCHRVVGSNGRLTGYAGGLEKKRRILESEGVHCEKDRVSLEERFTFGQDA
jgi:methylated-DNA-[protein]-cysteine S-methyltransferase